MSLPPIETKPISVTISEACRVSGLGRSSIYELIKQQKLKTTAIGRRRLVLFESLEHLITSQAA